MKHLNLLILILAFTTPTSALTDESSCRTVIAVASNLVPSVQTASLLNELIIPNPNGVPSIGSSKIPFYTGAKLILEHFPSVSEEEHSIYETYATLINLAIAESPYVHVPGDRIETIKREIRKFVAILLIDANQDCQFTKIAWLVDTAKSSDLHFLETQLQVISPSGEESPSAEGNFWNIRSEANSDVLR